MRGREPHQVFQQSALYSHEVCHREVSCPEEHPASYKELQNHVKRIGKTTSFSARVSNGSNMWSNLIPWLSATSIIAIVAGAFPSKTDRDLAPILNAAPSVSTKASRHPTISPQTTVRKRADTFPVAGGWQLQVVTYASLLPVETAAQTLEKFYTAISLRAGFQMVSDHFYRLRQGQLALEFFCQESPISWILVEDFTRIMAEAAKKGWTGSYSMSYTHPIRKVTIAIQLLWLA